MAFGMGGLGAQPAGSGNLFGAPQVVGAAPATAMPRP